MALQISYTDKSGAIHSEAYVKIDRITWVLAKSICQFDVGIYHDIRTRSKDDETKEKELVAHYKYHLNSEAYSIYLGEDVLKTADKSPLSQLYSWLKTHVDTPTDPTGNPNMGHDIDWTTAIDA